MRYFAYGSNMLEARLKDRPRVPSASCIGVGMLRGYRICFHKKGMDGSAKCNALETGQLDDVVYGVVFHIPDADVILLDKVEGVSSGGYSRRLVNIAMFNNSREQSVDCYIANEKFIDDSLLPFEWYKAMVVAGAIEHNLPEEYVQLLREHQSLEDRNQERAKKAIDILGPWRAEFMSGRLTKGSSRRS